jgi:hypothetical protein
VWGSDAAPRAKEPFNPTPIRGDDAGGTIEQHRN